MLSDLAAAAGVFRGADAVDAGVSRDVLARLHALGVVRRMLPDTYRFVAVPETDELRLRAALSWAGEGAAGAGMSAGAVYALENVRAPRPEIVVPRRRSPRHADVVTFSTRAPASLMVRTHRGIRVTGPEATLVRLAHLLDGEAFEVACEDARRRRLTTVPALRSYLDRFGRPGRNGVAATRALLRELDPVHPSRSTLEVKARRLLVRHGLTDFVREHPIDGYLFDFAFLAQRTILETNGRSWHDDPTDHEHDNEKWSVPGRHGFKVVFATWSKVTAHPDALVAEQRITLSA